MTAGRVVACRRGAEGLFGFEVFRWHPFPTGWEEGRGESRRRRFVFTLYNHPCVRLWDEGLHGLVCSPGLGVRGRVPRLCSSVDPVQMLGRDRRR